jgi:hypothetical protein
LKDSPVNGTRSSFTVSHLPSSSTSA